MSPLEFSGPHLKVNEAALAITNIAVSSRPALKHQASEFKESHYK